jgi:hypothetical protein
MLKKASGSVPLKRRSELPTDLEQRKAIVDQVMTSPDSRGAALSLFVSRGS